MIGKLALAMSSLAFLFAAAAAWGQPAPKSSQASKPMALPPPRPIPGITAKDQFPGGCVDCHIVYPDQKLDTRFSTLMKRLTEKVEPELLKRVAGTAPAGVKLKGKHPPVAASALKSIPNSCLPCHGKTSRIAPPFARMMHAIHLTGGKDSPFLTVFQGECTHCHKLATQTGDWSLASGPGK